MASLVHTPFTTCLSAMPQAGAAARGQSCGGGRAGLPLAPGGTCREERHRSQRARRPTPPPSLGQPQVPGGPPGSTHPPAGGGSQVRRAQTPQPAAPSAL